jgi:hypothetical protein
LGNGVLQAARKVKHQGEEIKQVLIHWKDRTADEATWEDEIMIRSQFPSLKILTVRLLYNSF